MALQKRKTGGRRPLSRKSRAPSDKPQPVKHVTAPVQVQAADTFKTPLPGLLLSTCNEIRRQTVRPSPYRADTTYLALTFTCTCFFAHATHAHLSRARQKLTVASAARSQWIA